MLFAAGYRANANAHALTFGELPAVDTEKLLQQIFETNLDGRGGAGFSTYRKIITTDRGSATTIIANAAEGEYLSYKDRMLLEHAPHLVLDGLAIAGRIIGTDNLVLYARAESLHLIQAAATARGVTCLEANGSFIAGEASAAVNALTGGLQIPLDRIGRLNQVPQRTGLFRKNRGPVLVHNAETLAHLALIARDGAAPYLTTEPASGQARRGTRILTVHNRHTNTAHVIEVPGLTTIDSALAMAEADHKPTPAVLVGGFQGRWATPAPDGSYPQAIGSPQMHAATGIIYPLLPTECPIDTTARITRYLANQSAGQRGPCANGLPELADTTEHLTSTTPPTSEETLRSHILHLMSMLTNRGICKHPDATVRFIANALETFHAELTLHAHGTCTAHQIPATA